MDIKLIKKFYCLGDFADVPVKLDTDSGTFESRMKGQILLEGVRMEEGAKLRIAALKATARAVECKAGSSGLISLGFVRRSDKLSLAKNGEWSATFKMNLHYPLIDRLHGFRPIREKEKDNFIPFVASVKGTITGKFAKPIASILREYKSIDSPPATDLSFAASLATDEYYVKKLEFKVQIKTFFPLSLMRCLTIQPVFVRSGPDDPSPTGWSFDTLMENARVMWRKCCIDFNVLPPIYIDDAAFKSISTSLDAGNLRAQATDDPDAIEIFVAGSLGSLESSWGGGASFSSGTAAAQIVTCDSQLEVFEGTTSRGAVNYNHYAHELGHVLSLHHPGLTTTPPMVAATANTVMEASGFYADNPHPQSHFNCDNADNPILRWTIVKWTRRCRHNPEI